MCNFCARNTANAQQDTIVLYKGEVLIGNIRGGDLGDISFDEQILKQINVKLYRIKRLTTWRRFKIQTSSRDIYYGVMKAAKRDGWVNIVEGNDSVELKITDIDIVTTLENKFWQQLNGNIAAGFSYAKSSGIGQINLSSTFQYATEKMLYQLSASAIWSIDTAEFSRDREDAGAFAAWNFRPTWFTTGGFYYQRNLELSLARRYQELVGMGNKIFLRKTWQLLALSGLTFNQELSTTHVTSGLLLEIPVIITFNFFKYSHPDIQINSTQSVFFSLSQAGRIRYDNKINFSWQLIRYFYITLNPYSSFDSKPPEGNSTFDYGVALSISYKF
jgi:hypothetical protein